MHVVDVAGGGEGSVGVAFVAGEFEAGGGVAFDELFAAAKELRAPLDVVTETARLGELPVPNFSAGGVATPSDASLMRQLGAQAVFVGSGIFKSENPDRVARAIVKATTHWDNPEILAEVSAGLGEPMHGLELSEIPAEERLAVRGW